MFSRKIVEEDKIKATKAKNKLEKISFRFWFLLFFLSNYFVFGSRCCLVTLFAVI